jgi:hypothetical protein
MDKVYIVSAVGVDGKCIPYETFTDEDRAFAVFMAYGRKMESDNPTIESVLFIYPDGWSVDYIPDPVRSLIWGDLI